MLTPSEAPASSRFGGWVLTESPPQRAAPSGQQWSLVIAVAAALVAMSAVVFDVRLSSDVSMPLVISPPPPSVETTQRSAAQVSPPATAVGESESTQTAALVAPNRTSTTTAEADSSAQTGARPAVTAESSSASTEAASETNAAAASVDGAALTDSSTEAAAAVAVDDPASRIREYLGLHAGAQLPVSFGYEVQPGDTASSIAKQFGLEEATVLFNNFDIYDADHLTVGQILTLPPVDGLIYTVQPGDHLDFLLENYQANLEATLGFPANGISSPDQIQAGQKLLLVHGSASVAAVSSSGSSGDSGGQSATVWTVPTFVWPLGYDKISDLFGTPRANSVGYHTGVDFVAAVGTIVGSTAAGQVTVATWDPSYGNWIEINHGGGYRSRYAHLDEIWVREGEWLQSNAYIGTVGNTGNSSGSHLHFEIIINGQAVNPLAWLN
jgi:murein DD-endopeptidase MepM/ murein hydrolase activator NlpD